MQISLTKSRRQRMPTIVSKDPITGIQAVVRGYFGLRPGELVGPIRTRRLAWPRHIAMALVRQKAKCSLPEIGRRFGGRDHTTVMYALRAVEGRRKGDPKYAADFVEIERRVEIFLGQSYVRREHVMGRPFVSIRGKGKMPCQS